MRAERDPFQLRALPHEDVYFYCKKIDNSRLVREADPRTRGACWSTIGLAVVILALLTGVLVPSAVNMVERYAKERDLAPPSPSQIVRLDGKGEGAVAMVKR